MRLYVGGLPYQTNEQDLIDLFGQVGNVVEASVITDRDTGRSKGFGFVEMGDDQSAQAAIDRFNGTLLGNRTITVNEARERQSGGGNRGSQGGYGNRGSQGGYDRNSNSGGYRNERY